MAKRESGRLMLESEIPAFVGAVIEAGCDICAIGHDCYVLGDLEEMDAAAEELARMMKCSGTGISSCWKLSHIFALSAGTWSQAHRRGIGLKTPIFTEKRECPVAWSRCRSVSQKRRNYQNCDRVGAGASVAEMRRIHADTYP
ncbi:hypothetical protein J2Z31_005340 [Sinorhizobium kostiense]|uniref:Uncharacterized protein n=2 Tax=Sinorhizobium kostiense TaxID=76747 RepID=A0ABS4R907_9HYPH|nr:hypothetical protein [Sinorhizobium kostiense]